MSREGRKKVGGAKGRLCVVLGVTALLLAAGLAVRPLMLFATAERAAGTVVEHRIASSNHYYLVQYDVGGRTHEIRSHWYSGLNRSSTEELHEGKAVTVLYRPDAPGEGRIGTFAELLGPSITAAIPGVGLLLYGLVPGGRVEKPGKSKKRRRG
jgi:hypothetical protein